MNPAQVYFRCTPRFETAPTVLGWINERLFVGTGARHPGEVASAYTLMLAETGQMSIAPSTYRRLPYHPQKDFMPDSQVVTADSVLLVNPLKVSAKNVREFVDWSRQQKGLFMATFGAGTPGHFGVFMFGDAIGQNPEPVHYKTTVDAWAASTAATWRVSSRPWASGRAQRAVGQAGGARQHRHRRQAQRRADNTATWGKAVTGQEPTLTNTGFE